LPKFLNRKRNYYVSHQDSPSTSEPSSHPSENKVRRHQNEQEEVDVGWKIIIFFLKSWFVIWVLFAIAAIATSLSHPHHPRKKVLNSQRNREGYQSAPRFRPGRGGREYRPRKLHNHKQLRNER